MNPLPHRIPNRYCGNLRLPIEGLTLAQYGPTGVYLKLTSLPSRKSPSISWSQSKQFTNSKWCPCWMSIKAIKQAERSECLEKECCKMLPCSIWLQPLSSFYALRYSFGLRLRYVPKRNFFHPKYGVNEIGDLWSQIIYFTLFHISKCHVNSIFWWIN